MEWPDQYDFASSGAVQSYAYIAQSMLPSFASTDMPTFPVIKSAAIHLGCK